MECFNEKTKGWMIPRFKPTSFFVLLISLFFLASVRLSHAENGGAVVVEVRGSAEKVFQGNRTPLTAGEQLAEGAQVEVHEGTVVLREGDQEIVLSEGDVYEVGVGLVDGSEAEAPEIPSPLVDPGGEGAPPASP